MRKQSFLAAGLLLATFTATANADTLGQWTYGGLISPQDVVSTVDVPVPECISWLQPYIDYNPDDMGSPYYGAYERQCIQGATCGTYGCWSGGTCPELSSSTYNNVGADAGMLCCTCSMPVNKYPANTNDMLVYAADPAVTWGVEATIFSMLDPLALSHVETCGSSSGGLCNLYWGQRANLETMLATVIDRNTPNTFVGKLLRWATAGYSKKKATCAAMMHIIWDIAEGVRHHGGWRQYSGTPRAAAAYRFIPTYVSATAKSSFASVAAAHVGNQYDYASLTTYNTYTAGWGGCSAAMASAWNLSRAEGARATNKSPAQMCSFAATAFNTLSDMIEYGLNNDYFGIDTDQLASCQRYGYNTSQLADMFANSFVNGAFARGDRGFQSFYSSGTTCDSNVIKEVNFVTAPSDIYHNLLGGKPGSNYTTCTSAEISTCAGGQCVKRQAADGSWPAMCWYGKDTRSAVCPYSSTFASASPNAAVYQAYPLMFSDGNDKCIKRADGVALPAGSQYRASTDFSSTQGYRGWRYYSGSITSLTPMVWNSTYGRWNASLNSWSILGSSWGHPNGTYDAIRRWTAPVLTSTTIRIRGTASDGDPGGGDGVDVKIYGGSTLLWSATIVNGNTTGVSFDFTTTVGFNSTISFVINQRGNSSNDTTNFDPIITFN